MGGGKSKVKAKRDDGKVVASTEVTPSETPTAPTTDTNAAQTPGTEGGGAPPSPAEGGSDIPPHIMPSEILKEPRKTSTDLASVVHAVRFRVRRFFRPDLIPLT